MIAVYPKKAQLEALLASPESGPVVMLNLLRFKAEATAPDDGSSGREAYMRYGEAMRKLVESRGGRFLWQGEVDSQVIGGGAEGFHVAALVEYPSRKAFVEIATSPEVAAIGVHRAAGLEGQWLLATTTRP
ncbi:MAG: DUF1330 domain-containing protein [Deltaproteobacteria bacterium]|nr:DUF1330 domain-containing protein [Deltaproteobacteria bacterium]